MKNTMPRQGRNPFHSIRYRLPATYALISLVVVLALGLVLYLTLRWYYTAQERAYLQDNAEPMVRVLAYMLPVQSQVNLETQVRFLSFLARTKVEIFDTEGQLLASGSTFERDSMFSPFNRSQGFFIASDQIPGEEGYDYLLISPNDNRGTVISEGDSQFSIQVNESDFSGQAQVWTEELAPVAEFFTSPGLPVGDIIPAFSPDRSPIARAWNQYRKSSTVVYSTPIENLRGEVIGTLRLSEGPAYGSQIIEGVIYGWLLASVVSVGLSIVPGWIASKDVINPLNTLTTTTEKMAEGDLSARVMIDRRDEFGYLAKSFNDMAQRIEETVTTLRGFMSDAAHEINTPITALRTNLELITPETGIHNVDRALSQLKRLEDLTKNLLQLSKLESNIDLASLIPVDAGRLMTQVAQFHASQAEQAGIDFVFNPPDKGLMIHVNEDQMHQAVSNLVHNAIKFTEPGGEVTISVQRIDKHVHFIIEDTGIGIPEEDLQYLFNRFHRGRNAVRFEGNGLGLAIVETIVTRYKGQIIARNTEHGAKFTVIMPLNSHESS